ncbi:hypothetical protein ACHAWU_005190 [Discostella pseudostelligera]|uniref:TFIIB-type domain-containing protein n=1 Tax=Discostella pseudostelligera TaxID=259834 RepID=A0ABD3MBA3_9STRA
MMYHPERLPRDPYYEYDRPYSTSTSSSSSSASPTCRPCPICQAPPTSFHADISSGDVICTNCGAVLDEKLRDDTAEWRDYSNNNSNNDTDVGVGRKRARCGDSIVDETKYIGGLMPTKISSTCFTGGGGGSAGGREDKFKLATIRQRLKRTHNVIENRIVQEQKARYAEIVLDRQAREAKLRRGETVSGEDADGAGGIVVEGGDYEGLMRQRQEQSSLLSPSSVSTIASSTMTTREPASTTATDHHEELAYASVEHPKWSLPDTLLLFGTLEQVQHHLPSSHHEDGGGWTQVALDNERSEFKKRIDANTRSSLHRLYIAYDLLERAARALDLYGGGGGSVSNATFRQAVATLIKFVIQNDGLRVRGISSGGLSSFSTLSLGDGSAATTTALNLSLFGGWGMAWSAFFDSESATSSSTSIRSSSKSTSPSTILHRLRQYASLGSAILYLAAKSTGVGRTLTEVCSAFGTFAVVDSNNGKSGGGGVADEPLVRPKYCSRAMQELRAALPDVVASLPQDNPVKNETVTLPPSQTPLDMATTHGRTLKDECIPEMPSSSIMDHHGDIASNPISAFSSEEAALVDLTTRIATSLGLPPIAIHAAATVTLQCARDVHSFSSVDQTRTQNSKRCVDKKHIRPSQRSRKLGGGNVGESPEVIAISSILLVCTAGGTMQRLARQAVSTSASSSSASSNPTKVLEVGGMSEDLNDDFLTFPDESRSCDAISPVKISEESSTTTVHQPNNALSPWEAWDDQPPWHREISQMEQCTGIPRKTIVPFYSKVIHPRRLFFLGLMSNMGLGCETSTTTRSTTAEATSAGLLHNIVAAAPLMSLRNL